MEGVMRVQRAKFFWKKTQLTQLFDAIKTQLKLLTQKCNFAIAIFEIC